MKNTHTIKYFQFLKKFKNEIEYQIRNDQNRKFGDDTYRGDNLLVGNKTLIHISDSDVFWKGVDIDEWNDHEHGGLGFVMIDRFTEVSYESYDIQKLKADIVAKYNGEGLAYEPSTEDLLTHFFGNYQVFHDWFDEEIKHA